MTGRISECQILGPRMLGRWLVGSYAALWLALAVAPVDRSGWALENLPVVLLAVALLAGRHRLTLSRGAMLCLFAFLCLHAIGAHYTYSLVPYDRWSEALTGSSLSAWTGAERNHYDRLVHLAYGLLLTGPIREALTSNTGVRGRWRHVLPVMAVLSLSAVYEIVEWGAALLFGGDLGLAYVGAQGDPWDAEKDMALAALGTLIATAVVLAAEWRNRRRS